jgi:cytochrome c-type biogenesis protein CcmH
LIWIALILVSIAAMSPLVWSLRRDAVAKGRQQAAIRFHRGQLAELDRDLADSRIGATEHSAAVLEVQRRLLAAREDTDLGSRTRARSPVLVAIILVPLAAFALYVVGGSPNMPSVPHAELVTAIKQQRAKEDQLIKLLRDKLRTIKPHTEQARQGYILLGNTEASRGDMKAAAEAWNTALATRFDPTLAVETAEAMTEAAGSVTDQAAALFRRALDAAPANAPWRPMAERRLAGIQPIEKGP